MLSSWLFWDCGPSGVQATFGQHIIICLHNLSTFGWLVQGLQSSGEGVGTMCLPVVEFIRDVNGEVVVLDRLLGWVWRGLQPC